MTQSMITPELTVETEVQRLESQNTRFRQIITDNFSGTRLNKLNAMYDGYGNRLLEAPASSRTYYHNAYAGGYIDHVLNVYDASVLMAQVLKKMHGWVDFTKAELTMAALHHDLYKLGFAQGEPYYVPEESDWHRKNQNSMFKHNEKLSYMKVTDGALFILQQFGIELTQNETLAIKLSDGLYDDANKAYLMNYAKFPIHTNLPYVIHWGDHMSATIERDPLKQEFVQSLTEQ